MRFTRFRVLSDISLPTANLLYSVSNLALIVGAVLAVVGTVGTIWMGSIRELHSDQRVSANEARTAEAVQASEEANEQAEALKAESLKLQIQLEKERQERIRLERKIEPRSISKEQGERFINALGECEPCPVCVTGVLGDPESIDLANDLARCFQAAGWAEGHGFVQAVFTEPQYDVMVNLNPEDIAGQHIPKQASVITQALCDMGFNQARKVIRSERASPGEISVIVGHKPIPVARG